MAFAGDVNADGKDDVLASSKRHVALIFGQGSDGAPNDISTLNSEGYGLLRTRPAGLLTVATVAAAGDVDGDGKADFAYCDEFASQPRCQVFFRSLVLTDQAQDPLATGDWQVDGFAGAPTPPLLATGADLNQDGFADLLLADSDAAYVVFGRDDGFGAVDVTSLGSDGFSLAAPMPGAIGAVSTIGDVNGDGYGDFALGQRPGVRGVRRPVRGRPALGSSRAVLEDKIAIVSEATSHEKTGGTGTDCAWARLSRRTFELVCSSDTTSKPDLSWTNPREKRPTRV